MEENKNESQGDAPGEVRDFTSEEVLKMMHSQPIILMDSSMRIEKAINTIIDNNKSSGLDTNLISDGYHTFGELYEHRIELFIKLCSLYYGVAWKSHLHSDGSSMTGWFIMGLYVTPGEQISYHLPVSYWDRCKFARTMDQAPEWDGHTSADVLKRLREL